MTTKRVNKSLRWLVLLGAVATTAVTMPSCPGQQAMQKQIDDLTKREAKLNEKMSALDAQVKSMNTDLSSTIKPLLQETAKTVVDDFKPAVQKLDARLTALEQRPAPTPAKGKKAPPAKAHKKK